MGDDEQYYFEDQDQYGDDDGGEEETWETEVENNYANAKASMDRNPSEAIKGFLSVITDDQDKGRWTFKAHKQLCRCYLKTKEWGRLIDSYKKALSFQYPEKTRQDTEKAINKLLDRCAQCETSILLKLYNETLQVVERDKRNYEKLWFSVRMKVAQIAFESVLASGSTSPTRFDELFSVIAELKEWAMEGENPEQRKGTSLVTIYALEIEVRSEIEDFNSLRALYVKATSIKSVIVPPKLMGIIHECGGKMCMRQGQWQEANDTFFAAFRSFDEAGHPRRMACLRYLLLANMLSGAKINPFDTQEVKSYQNEPEIVAMRLLIDACAKNDVKGFERVLKDQRNTKSIFEDKFLFRYLEPLVKKVRAASLVVMVKPYQSITLEYIARMLSVKPKEAEALLVSLILDGRLNAKIDQIRGVLYLVREDQHGAADERHALLEQWATQQESLQNMLVRRALSVV